MTPVEWESLGWFWKGPGLRPTPTESSVLPEVTVGAVSLATASHCVSSGVIVCFLVDWGEWKSDLHKYTLILDSGFCDCRRSEAKKRSSLALGRHACVR